MISNVVLFIGGPKNFQTEEIDHPQSYLQFPEKINQFVGLGSDAPFAALEPNYKIVTYRLEKYRPGPTIIIPMYVAQGLDTEEASRYAGEYFLQLMLNQHTATKPINTKGWKENFQQALKSVEIEFLTAGSWSTEEQFSGSLVIGQLTKLFPQLATTSGVCPSKDCGAKGKIGQLIQHLNDLHQWKIETDIADWLESLDIKFEVKA